MKLNHKLTDKDSQELVDHTVKFKNNSCHIKGKIKPTENEYISEMNTIKEKLLEDNDSILGQVGIFWYLPDDNKLFEVSKINIEEIPEKLHTIPIMHENVWKKQYYRLTKGNKNLSPVYKQEYHSIPRGRIFFYSENNSSKINLFKIMIGEWINDYPEAKQLIIEEFNLESENYVFEIDYHWNIGHGYSGDHLI